MATNPERTSSGLLQINVINIQNNFPIQKIGRASCRERV